MESVLTKIIIAGGRNFNNYKLLESFCLNIIDQLNIDEDNLVIISGNARGADFYGEKFAEEMGYSLHKYPANWNLYGKRAGYLRNEEMASKNGANADILIAFWDGESKGTKHMIDIMSKKFSEDKEIIYSFVNIKIMLTTQSEGPNSNNTKGSSGRALIKEHVEGSPYNTGTVKTTQNKSGHMEATVLDDLSGGLKK